MKRRCSPAATLSREGIERRVVEEIALAERYGVPLCVVMLCLDPPQPTPEQVGRLGFALRSHIRRCDQLGQWRSAQFLVAAPALPLIEAAGLAVKLRRFVDEWGNAQAERVPLTASLGVAEYRPGERLSRFLTRAGRAMHAARRYGGNRVETG